jgi:hypothetical protein
MRLLRAFWISLVAAGAVCTAGCGGSSRSTPHGSTDAGDDGSAADAGGDDAGLGDAPVPYPAPHPPLPLLSNAAGGPVLTTPHVYLVLFPSYPYASDLQTFAQKTAASTYWTSTTHEYGVGALTYEKTIQLTDPPPPSPITQASIETWVGTALQSGQFGTPDPEGIYTIVYPQGTTITQPNPVSSLLGTVESCVAFGGYHDNVAVALGDGGASTTFAYAVLPTCSSSVDELTSAMSHEWVEAATDPAPTSNGVFTLAGGADSAFFTVDTDHSIWEILGGGEAGDLCEPESGVLVTPTDIGHTVQRTWSNVQAKASHDPCAPPVPGLAFFDSAPVLPETVTLSSPIIGTWTTQGVTIPVGQSKTIEVDLFSDADTHGPWKVTAVDALHKYYGSYGFQSSLSFAWDRTEGVNGDKLHLTITVTATSAIGGGHVFLITSSQGARSVAWPGLVVE